MNTSLYNNGFKGKQTLFLSNYPQGQNSLPEVQRVPSNAVFFALWLYNFDSELKAAD